ncbi:MAG: glycosyltransferase family 4 protein [Thaumarchaeota archaeon]|nr:MAG: glycosyltransferase family 4 protein [Nitrososphaerota archaeon]
MHILHIVPNFLDPIGGEEIFIRGLIYHFQRKHKTLQSIITQSNGRQKEVVQHAGATVISLPVWRLGYYNVLSGLPGVLLNDTYDIINIKSGYFASDFSVPFPSMRQRIRSFFHHFLYDYTLGKLETNTFDKVIIQSEDDRRYLSKNGLKEDRIVKIPIAINEIFFKYTSAVPRSDRYYILYAGRIDPFKGLDVLAKAIKELKSIGISLKCIIAGKDCGYGSQLRFLLNKLDIVDQVEVRDYISQENLLELYSHAVVTVLPSLSEGFSLALVESIATGTPFIATPVGANPELVALTNAGILVPVGEPKILAETILHVIKDEQLWSNMSTNGQKSVSNFSYEKVVEKHYQVYSELTK